MALALDGRDRALLALLQEDAWRSYAALSKIVNLSPSAVQRRVERLVAGGAILGATVRLGPTDVPASMVAYVLVELRDDAMKTVELFARHVAETDQVLEAHYVTGEADVVLKIRVPDMDAYNRFVETRLNASPVVLRFKTLAALRSLKS